MARNVSHGNESCDPHSTSKFSTPTSTGEENKFFLGIASDHWGIAGQYLNFLALKQDSFYLQDVLVLVQPLPIRLKKGRKCQVWKCIPRWEKCKSSLWKLTRLPKSFSHQRQTFLSCQRLSTKNVIKVDRNQVVKEKLDGHKELKAHWAADRSERRATNGKWWKHWSSWWGYGNRHPPCGLLGQLVRCPIAQKQLVVRWQSQTWGRVPFKCKPKSLWPSSCTNVSHDATTRSSTSCRASEYLLGRTVAEYSQAISRLKSVTTVKNVCSIAELIITV